MAATTAHTQSPEDQLVVGSFVQLLLGNDTTATESFEFIEREWHPGFIPMSLEILGLGGSATRNARLVGILEANTDQALGSDLSGWYEWLWNQPPQPHPTYGYFKSVLYSLIDPAFEAYFSNERETTIRLDEIRWGGVRQDGIPPLRGPRMLGADEADYLEAGNIVFGLEVNGDARAYPRRILAWHEMFVDEVGGVDVVGVYCTLCGTMILYDTEHDGVVHELGTSGFLYRSNKLMYDRATQSLWNTIWGTPAVGPLVGRGIELERMSVVTTTWGAWRERHPETLVLSLATGYTRDYSEGAAYRDYFATDRLMFTVPELDRRLNNKDEVLTLLLPKSEPTPLAFASAYLKDNPFYQDEIGGQAFTVLTDASGAHRVYDANGVTFVDWDQYDSVIDEQGTRWALSEARLETADGRIKDRLPSHNAFWFGWYSAYPSTQLVH